MRLEQGRATRPSDRVVEALARALHLEAPERDHLYRLAHLPPPATGRVSTHIPPSVHRLLAPASHSSGPREPWDSTSTTTRPSPTPLVGDITLDCDVLAVPGADLKIVAYTAPAGTPPAEKLDFLRVTAINTYVTTDSL